MTKVRWRSTNGIMCLSTGQPSPPSRHYPDLLDSLTLANSDGRPQRLIQSRPSSHPSLHEDGGDRDKPFKSEDWHQAS
uniref:Uncharacterized protein n=1 Tax=Oryza rufipogon TaxID=4529 RepID=A0A0E0QFR5_ORYRU